MNVEQLIQQEVSKAVQMLYGFETNASDIQIQKTKKEFEGDLTVVTFPFVKPARKAPELVGNEIGNYLIQNNTVFTGFNVIKGFLNLNISRSYWIELLNAIAAAENYGVEAANADAPTMMIEYSSPNTNKPLHLGHIRNNLLGFSVSEIQKANGWKVVKTNIVNDRGIHICKSMLAWQKWGNGETHESSGLKGDHLVGKYYVEFDKHLKAEVKDLMSKGLTEDEAKNRLRLCLRLKICFWHGKITTPPYANFGKR